MVKQQHNQTPRLELSYSKPKIVVFGLCFAFITAWLLLFLAGAASGDKLMVLLLLVAAPAWGLFALPLGRKTLQAITANGPPVTIDVHGITDVRLRTPFVDWSHIGQAYLGYGMSFYTLHIEFRSPNVAKSYIKKPYLLRQAVGRASHMSLSDLNIDLFGLSYSRAQVTDFIKTLHTRALREQIADNSANKGSGWSGTL